MKNFFVKTKEWFSRHLPTKRRLIQLYSALLFNCYSKGYITGEIFTGISKNLCTPGLNCYSCPGAVTSCPLGALQNSLSAANKTAPFYMLGIIMLYGVIFGRWICGWLCPFGLLQDLLHKIKTPKLKKSRFTRVLSFFKYVILVVFVAIIPLLYMLRDFPLPAFCKYICPAGTVGGAIGLLINPNNSGVFEMLGPLFTWKFALAMSILVGAVFIYRIFCRFLCPLGALYGLFNKFALFGIKLEKNKCIDCGKCVSVCEMDIHHVGDVECINCGKCIGVCPTKAISWKGSKIILPENEIGESKTEASTEKREKRVKILNRITAAVLAVVLCASFVYCNFIYGKDFGDGEPPVVDDPTDGIPYGSSVGDRCTPYSLELVDSSGKISIKDLKGKIVIVNFWGTWCGPCKQELPDFDRVATDYDGEVVVLTVHSVYMRDEAPDYIAQNFPDSKMLFAYDLPGTPKDFYYSLLGGSGFWPRTLVLDENGIITFTRDGSVHYDQLVNEIQKIQNN